MTPVRYLSTWLKLWLSSTSIPSRSHFFSFQIVSGKIKRCSVASVARSKADAKLFSGKPGDKVCGSFPKAKPHMLSKVSRSKRSCRSTGLPSS
ncbi:hypothetical protein HanIR_Chr17g0846151 [Helianthus annuus]|nr:hypothetical protein HanIR_Chr17g0846151 [Helianthus annuus]